MIVKFPESKFVHRLLDGKHGIEIGASAHNSFGLDTMNVDCLWMPDTFFKKEEIKLCGKAAQVDVAAEGDCLPFKDGCFDFVLSSHVIEHFPDPIKALK